ncbi:type II secretion system protein E [Parvibaculum lavamentivorans DS-1]|uniref:Type II secretion system protein E n=1 Tax=Parvibaculum lavamentivorans (strain DS-1 / DSM 13023 / NCIMB 13966) TaxID=402881 RepID=A7HP62_PARL1|nr:CpaF family protein [Parvibaculum lavamentivorans]ABS61695.1 type II secretion system protein E [Parvibaculum lavamentivorans DS-1]
MKSMQPYTLGTDSPPSDIGISDRYQEIKFRVFDLTLEYLDQQGVEGEAISLTALQDEIARAIAVVLMSRGIALNMRERAQLIEDVQNEIVGFGPLEPLLRDPTIDDIIVNGPARIYVERHGELELVQTRFRDTTHLMNVIQRIVSPIGRRVDEGTPYVDGRLPDGSRVNVIIPPVALDGPILSVRKFKHIPLTGDDLVRSNMMTPEMLKFLSGAVRGKRNILICGGTGSGKTTLLNVLSSYIGIKERLVTIEDAAELQLQQSHVVRLETRPSSPDGANEVTARDLLRNVLRMRPDRIILGEVRSSEAIEMLQAMGTGHDGSMATLHANGPRDALERLEMLIGLHGFSADLQAVRRFIAGAIHIVVQTARQSDGKRRIVSICEVTGMEGPTYSMRQIFSDEEVETKRVV